MRAPEFWEKRGVLAMALAPLGLLYGAAGILRRQLARPLRLPVKVICVGNLVSGGAGKTPVVLDLLECLKKRGLAVHALSRGYGGQETGPLLVDPDRHAAHEVGDEPLLLARAAPTWIARERAAGARAAVAAGAEVIVMDDGFQNPGLAKDLSLLVFDAEQGFGNGFLIPAGPLREFPRDGLARADAFVLIGGSSDRLRANLDGRPLLEAALEPLAGAASFRNRRVLAFAGIGRPQKFFTSLAATGAEVLKSVSFPDHHAYSSSELQALDDQARSASASLVTTTKDHVRLPGAFREKVTPFEVGLRWAEPQKLETLLDTLFKT